MSDDDDFDDNNYNNINIIVASDHPLTLLNRVKRDWLDVSMELGIGRMSDCFIVADEAATYSLTRSVMA